MRIRFDPRVGQIRLPLRILGPLGNGVMTVVLDTGSTHTVLSRETLGYYGLIVDPNTPTRGIITGSGRVNAPRITIPEFGVGEMLKQHFVVFALDFPQGSGIDGVLGLDFLRSRKLTLDFKEGILEID